MTRLSFIFLLAISLSACGGPIETRVANIGYGGANTAKTYIFARSSGQESNGLEAAQNIVESVLQNKGFAQTEEAHLLIEIALADRPADIGITIGGEAEVKPIAQPKKQKPLQSCADREYRLKLLITERSTGKLTYQGEASEYHCKARIDEVIPYLAEAALSDFGTTGSKFRTDIRQGLE